MNSIELHALRPSHPVGFLAALGLHRVVTRDSDPAAELSWSEAASPHAILHTTLDRGRLVEACADAWLAQAEREAVLMLEVDGRATPFPPAERLVSPAAGQGNSDRGLNDPVKMLIEPRSEYGQYAQAALQSPEGDAVAWVRAVATDVVLNETAQPVIASLTGFYLLSRQQTMARSLRPLWDFAADNDVASALEAALTGWRRVLPTPGMNWDIDGSKNAAETPDGKPWTGVDPGATWLAVMSLPYFPISGADHRARTRGFESIKRGRRSRRLLVMPCWRPALDGAAIEVLLDHPLLEIDTDRGHLRADQLSLERLGISAVYGAEVVERRVGGQVERYLGASRALGAGT